MNQLLWRPFAKEREEPVRGGATGSKEQEDSAAEATVRQPHPQIKGSHRHFKGGNYVHVPVLHIEDVEKGWRMNIISVTLSCFRNTQFCIFVPLKGFQSVG